MGLMNQRKAPQITDLKPALVTKSMKKIESKNWRIVLNETLKSFEAKHHMFIKRFKFISTMDRLKKVKDLPAAVRQIDKFSSDVYV
jgi:hypothetical protein